MRVLLILALLVYFWCAAVDAAIIRASPPDTVGRARNPVIVAPRQSRQTTYRNVGDLQRQRGRTVPISVNDVFKALIACVQKKLCIKECIENLNAVFGDFLLAKALTNNLNQYPEDDYNSATIDEYSDNTAQDPFANYQLAGRVADATGGEGGADVGGGVGGGAGSGGGFGTFAGFGSLQTGGGVRFGALGPGPGPGSGAGVGGSAGASANAEAEGFGTRGSLQTGGGGSVGTNEGGSLQTSGRVSFGTSVGGSLQTGGGVGGGLGGGSGAGFGTGGGVSLQTPGVVGLVLDATLLGAVGRSKNSNVFVKNDFSDIFVDNNFLSENDFDKYATEDDYQDTPETYPINNQYNDEASKIFDALTNLDNDDGIQKAFELGTQNSYSSPYYLGTRGRSYNGNTGSYSPSVGYPQIQSDPNYGNYNPTYQQSPSYNNGYYTNPNYGYPFEQQQY